MTVARRITTDGVSASPPATTPKNRTAKRPAADENEHEVLRKKAEDALSKAIVELMRREPFFAHVISGLPRVFTEQVPTMAVGLRGETVQLLINPKFLVEVLGKAVHRVAVLKHEILHVILKHLFRRVRKEDPLLWNIAADLVVNQFVAPFELPEGAVVLASFPELRLPPNETVERYYDLLRGPARDPGGFPETCGLIGQLREGGGATDHSMWANGPSRSVEGEATGSGVSGSLASALEKAIEDRLVRAHERTRATRGTIPAWLERLIEEILDGRKAKVDWRRVLRIFAASSKRTRIVTTRRRESRRFESIPGVRLYEGLKVKRYQRMAVVIDTSGSVGAEQFAAFFAEIRGIHRAGAEIMVIECDAAIGKVWTFDGRIPPRVTGGGGTSFDPPMEWLRNPRNGRFDACVYLTDGGAPAPSARPPCPMLWVICDGDGKHLPGRVVTLE